MIPEHGERRVKECPTRSSLEATVKRALLSFSSLLALCAAVVPAAAASVIDPRPAQGGGDDFMTRYGFAQVEQVRGTEGHDIVIYRPEGATHDGVELALLHTPEGFVESAILTVTRHQFTVDSGAMQALVGDYLLAMWDTPDTRRLAWLIGHDDEDVRRGTKERSSRCCAIPPERTDFVAAVAVVDDLEASTKVEADEVMLHFENGVDRQGRPALTIRLSAAAG